LGYLVSQQLVAAGEQVIDVPAMMAARVRLLDPGKSQKNDPNDARSVAIAALRRPGLMLVGSDDHTRVLGLLVQERLGHASIKTTLDTYGHLFEGLDEAAADRLEVTYFASPVSRQEAASLAAVSSE